VLTKSLKIVLAVKRRNSEPAGKLKPAAHKGTTLYIYLA
jgi:hypothetical protein